MSAVPADGAVGPGTDVAPGAGPSQFAEAVSPTASVGDLVAGLIAAHDLASAAGPDGSEGGVAVQVQLERTLRGAGIDRLLVAEGDLFDPAFHMVAATEPAPEASLERRVAREVRAGWSSPSGVVRPAEVVVWTSP